MQPVGASPHALLSGDASRSPLEEADEFLGRLREEARRQRQRAQRANLGIVTSTASIPVLLLLSTEYADFWLGKIMPAALAAVATAAVLLLQVTKPHERWRLLGARQAGLEIECFRYVHRLGSYGTGDCDALLLEEVALTAKAIGEDWARLMPSSKETAQLLADQ
jgi:hypothetical protein